MLSSLRRSVALLAPALVRHATKKSGGSGGVVRTSNPKYLGLKIPGDQFAKAGSIIMRQRGAQYYPGENVSIGRDYTLFALRDGWVEFQRKRLPPPSGSGKGRRRTWIHLRPGTKEEHRERVKQRVELRNSPYDSMGRLGVWHKLQAGMFAERGAAKS